MRKTLLLGLLAIASVGSAYAASNQASGNSAPNSKKASLRAENTVYGRDASYQTYGDTTYGADGLMVRRSSGSAHISAPGQKTRTCQMFNNTAVCD